MRVLANDGISGSGYTKLVDHGFYVVQDKIEQDNLAEFINKENIEVLLVRSATKVTREIMSKCPGLKYVGRGGGGLDTVDLAAAKELNIEVFNTPAASSQAVAELVIGHLITMTRSLHTSNRLMPDSDANTFKKLKKTCSKGIELRGKTLGIIGLGRIGRNTAMYALGMGMQVIASDRSKERVTLDIEVGGVNINYDLDIFPKSEVYKQADFISLHVPAQDGAYLIGKEEMNKMKDGAFLINLSRGGLVDEIALIDALNSGKLAGAALDVFETEPVVRKEILQNEKISLSPHTGAGTFEAQDRIGIEIADFLIKAYAYEKA
jgi:D-3-phosphoglycerate dehydrogenase